MFFLFNEIIVILSEKMNIKEKRKKKITNIFYPENFVIFLGPYFFFVSK